MFLDNLYTLIQRDENRFSIKLSDEAHPLFQAHFPNNPILPGFIHVDVIEKEFNIKLKKLKRAKFLKMAFPKDILTYKKDGNKFEVLKDGEIITSLIGCE